MPQDTNRDAAGQGLSDMSWDKGASNSIQEDVARARDEAERQGAGAMDSLKDGARSLGDEARERASRYVEGGKEAVTGHLDTFAQAIRAASDELSEKDQTMAAQLVRQAAGGLESLSRSIGGASIHDMIDSVRSFGRSNPTAFIGVAVLGGLALGRFARASSHRASNDWRRDSSGWDNERGYGQYGGGRGRDQMRGEFGSDRGGFNEGLQPYSGPSYPTGERAAFAPATHGGADTPPRAQGYAGGGMSTDPIQSTGSQSHGSQSHGSQSQGSQSQGSPATGSSSSAGSGPSSATESSVGSSFGSGNAQSGSGGATQSGSISTGER